MRSVLRLLSILLVFVVAAKAQYPVSDSFATAGPLSGNWTQTNVAGFFPVTINPAGSAGIANGNSGYGAASWTGNSFSYFGTYNQYAQVTVVSINGNADRNALCVLMSTSGGYCYSITTRQFFKYSTSGGNYPNYVGGYGPYANPGNVLKLTAQNGTVSLYLNGTFAMSLTDSTYTTGSPGIYVDRSSTSATSQLGSFQADCYPSSCGTIPPPAVSEPGATYGPAQTITLSTPTAGAAICYTLDGSTPSITSPGTCGGGTTQVYSNPITISSGTETINAIATTSSVTLPSIVASNTYNIVGVQIIANTPFFPLQVLPGSSREINVQINYGTSNKVNWSATTTGGATVSFNNGQSSLSNDAAIANVVFGGTGGSCALTGSLLNLNATVGGGVVSALSIVSGGSGFPPNTVMNGAYRTGYYQSGGATTGATFTATTNSSGVVTSVALVSGGAGYTSAPGYQDIAVNYVPYTITSSSTVTVTAQAVDQPSHTATFNFNVCQATDNVHVNPFYQAVYAGQTAQVYSHVEDANEAVTWSLISQPAGASVSLPDTGYRDIEFPGSTVSGRYVVQACSTVSPTHCSTGIIFVGPTALPYQSTPAKTKPVDCVDNDPAMTGPIYTVGPGKTYSTLGSTPTWSTWAPGTKMQVFNTDPTGTSPTSFNEWIQISSNGSPSQPIVVCGVPDAAGNMPIIGAGSNLTTQPGLTSYWAAYDPDGTIMIYPPSKPYGSYGAGQNPTNIVVGGLHVEGAQAGNTAIIPSGNVNAGNVLNVSQGAAGVNVEAGSSIVIQGNWLDTDQNSVFVNDNGYNLWANLTQDIFIEGNALTNYGNSGGYKQLVHGMYVQALRAIITANYFGLPISGSQGGALKIRGEDEIVSYNSFTTNGSSPLRLLDAVENQDIPQYFSFEAYLGANNNRSSIGAVSSPNGSFQYGCFDGQPCNVGDTIPMNLLATLQEEKMHAYFYGNIAHLTSSIEALHYREDHDGQMAGRNGLLSVYNNTFDNCYSLLDTNTSGGYNTYYVPHFYVANNICWSSINLVTEHYTDTVAQWQRNLFPTGSVSLTTPITYSSSSAPSGWPYTLDYNAYWPGTNPLDAHQITSAGAYGINPADWLYSTTTPYNTSTFIPPAGSAAINAGSALQGPAALLPVRYQYSPANYSLTPRQNALTIGGADSGPPPTLQGVSVSPSTASGNTENTASFVATCSYSDGSTTNCTSAAAWSTSNAQVATVSGGTVTAGVTGTATITATVSGFAGTATYTVLFVPKNVLQGIYFKGVGVF